jgi:hypothetical protein
MPDSELQQATFAEVEKHQRELIFDYLQQLRKEKRPLTDDEREDFWQVLAFSTLGLGIKTDFVLKSNGNKYDLGCLEVYCRQLSFETGKNVEINAAGKRVEVPIEKLWMAMQNCLYVPMAMALTRSFDQSPEIIMRKGGAYEFPKTKEKIKE